MRAVSKISMGSFLVVVRGSSVMGTWVGVGRPALQPVTRTCSAGAAAHLEKGNALCRALWEKQGRAYDPQDHTRLVDDLLAAFTPEYFARTRGFGLDTEAPVFIVGLPRSGTSEQLLDRYGISRRAIEANVLRLAS